MPDELSRVELLAKIRVLPEHTGVTRNVASGHPSLKQVWIRWLSEYEDRRSKRKNPTGNARTIYNRLEYPEQIVWLAGASGVDVRKVRQAAAMLPTRKSKPAIAAAIREVLPWALVARHLNKVSDGAADTTVADIDVIRRTVRSKTTQKVLIEARLGQGKFRAGVAELWGWKCAVTDCAVPEILRASHIKPWSKSTNHERLARENGLFLTANIDALFDKGLIAFQEDGSMLISDKISTAERRRLGIPRPLARGLTEAQREFLAFHRQLHRFPAKNSRVR